MSLASAGVRGARPSDPSELDRAVGLREVLAMALGGPDELEIDTTPRVGRFVLDKKLGRGGMGVVYRARDVELDRVVALKFLHAFGRGDERERLIQEARALARLSDPCVIAIYEVGVHEDRVYFAMEYVEGGNLRQWLATHPDVDWRTVLDVFVQAGRGLAAAHEAGIVHRDFKPENVLVSADGRVRVGDFGLALMASATRRNELDRSYTSALSDTVEPTSIAGTPGYMAPEQRAGQGVGPRTDQYSFCRSLRECLDHVAKGPARSRPRWPGRLDRIIARGLAEDPEGRHPDMRALLVALERFRGRGRVRAIAGGVVTVVGLLLATRLGAGSGPDPGETCRERSDLLRAAIGEPPLARLEEAFRRSELGPETLTAIRPAFEDYGARWAAAYVDACDATWRSGAQSSVALDLRLDCLDRRRVHVERLLSSLADADERMIITAPSAVSELPSLEPCARAEQLARVAPPPDAGVEVIEEVTAIELELAAARADLLLSGGAELIALAERLVARAMATSHAPTIARAHLLHGHALIADDRPVKGVFERAFIAAQRGFDDHTAFTASLDLSAMHVGGSLDAAGAKFWLDAAEALAHRLELGSDALAAIELERGYVALFAMDTQAAIEAFQRGLELFDAQRPRLERAKARSGLGLALDQAGRFDEAIAIQEQAVEELTQLMGPRHPVVLGVRGNVATALLGAGRLDDARSALQGLVDAHAQDPSGRSAEVGARLNLAEVERQAGRYQEAEAYGRAVIEQLERGPEGSERHLITAYHNLAAVLEHVGRYEEALALARRSVALVRRTSHHEQPQLVARAQLNEAVMLWRLGAHDEARALLDVVIAAYVDAIGNDDVELTRAYEARAAVELSLGHHAAAVENAELGLAVLSGRDTPDPYARARLELRRAEGLLGLGKHEAASEALEVAREGFGDDDIERGWATFLLARAQWAAGEGTTARERAVSACSMLAGASTPHDREWLGACEAWLEETR